MSRRGNCWDNAVAESFFSSLKKERIRKRIYKTRDLARADVFDYIEVFDNRTRRHSHSGGISPEAFEQAAARGSKLSRVPGAVHHGSIGVYEKLAGPVGDGVLAAQELIQHTDRPDRVTAHAYTPSR